MAKEIHFPYGGTEYTLKFTLNSVKVLEQAGFVLEEIETKPTVRVQQLFEGAFIANHRGIKRKTIDDIWNTLKRKDDLVTALVEMYADARNSLVEDEGNEDWTITE